VADEHRPARHEVGIECLRRVGAYPDGELLARIVAAGRSGALVAIVVNLVDDAQRLARALRELTRDCPEIVPRLPRNCGGSVPCPLSFLRPARQRSRRAQTLRTRSPAHVRTDSGRHPSRRTKPRPRLDFDWLITQICPVDLLFQRLGRLHRHKRDQRPPGFETPRCTVLTVERDDYGVFELIYGNARVLWRTEQLVAHRTTAHSCRSRVPRLPQCLPRLDRAGLPARRLADRTREGRHSPRRVQ